MSEHRDPSVSTPDNDLRAAGIAEIVYYWKGKRYSQMFAPGDVITSREHIEGRLREAVAAYLVWRDGKSCTIRSMLCTMGENSFTKPSGADFDHIDGNKQNHRLGNLRLACHSCNSHLQWKQKIRPATSPLESVRKSLPLTPMEVQSDTIRLNIDLWPEYIKWLGDTIATRRSLSVHDAIHEAARELKVSTGHGSSETTRRYLNDLTAGPTSPFIIEGGVVLNRPKTGIQKEIELKEKEGA